MADELTQTVARGFALLASLLGSGQFDEYLDVLLPTTVDVGAGKHEPSQHRDPQAFLERARESAEERQRQREQEKLAMAAAMSADAPTAHERKLG